MPSIGIDRVENVLDAAHALSLQCRRNLAIRKRSEVEERQHLEEEALPKPDPFRRIHRRVESTVPDLRKTPPVPDQDLLLFIRDHNPFLQGWEQDLLTIVHEEAQYFIPQIETKIMNEGWASFVHKRILDALELPQELHLEFLVRHNQVVRPIPGGLNPYHLGLKLWEDLERMSVDPTPEERRRVGERHNPRDLLFETREADRDVSFLRRWLTPRLARELDLFRFEPKGDDLVVSDVADDEGWEAVREQLLRNVGMSSVPVIQVEDADFGGARALLLAHAHDGRDLQLEDAEKTLAYVHRLWGHEVVLDTTVDGKHVHLTYGERGFTSKSAG